jgi:7,8-dihydropterin-6-yl-methyl-4-(beta-D-ribofuranosyl)aminobenzene 5'-phosphate synthase
MKKLLVAAALIALAGSALAQDAAAATRIAVAAEPKSQITILYDAFGTDAAMKKNGTTRKSKAASYLALRT